MCRQYVCIKIKCNRKGGKNESKRRNENTKKIHYCWFGGGDLPDSVQKCIESWKKYCKDYEIIRWDETNYDYTKNQYMLEAYQAKKYGFVSDYARLDIVYHHGGIYFDTDVEVIKPLDELLCNSAFMGFENNYIALGLGFGAERGIKELKEMMKQYEKLIFINSDGSLNLKPITKYTTEYLETQGLVANGSRQRVGNIEIYPMEYFCPKNILTSECKITSKTYSIHHYDASWWGEEEKKEHERQVALRKKSVWLWRIVNGYKMLKEEGIITLMKKIKNMKK